VDIFEKLMLARQLSFKEGEIDLLGQRLVMLPSIVFSDYTMAINDSPDKVAEFYKSVKSSSKANFAVSVGKSYGFNFQNYFDWMTKIVILSGWGIWKWDFLDEEKKSGKISVTNSPVAENLKGKVKCPVDHIIRGFMAGGASASLKTDVDVVEEECVALGAPQCKFVFKSPDQFNPTPEVIRQIGQINRA
jgi:predicted hydrocarbon binding protein